MSNKRALISVSDKTNIIDFAKKLINNNYEIISTGGTYKYLQEQGIDVVEVEELTQFPEILDGRVKTLHPAIHSGILAKRNKYDHLETLKEYGLGTIDMVVVNLYPFFQNASKDISLEEKIEFIDIGGPTMLRAAAKSFYDVTVITDFNDYELVLTEIERFEDTTIETRQYLASKVFNLTSAYDAAIFQTLSQDKFPYYLNSSYKKVLDLRYGENPHQQAAFYIDTIKDGAMNNFEQLGGKELSFNNLRDMDMAWKIVSEFTEMTCCAIKHSTPCGVAIGETPLETYIKTFECDSISIFGGIVACNYTIDLETAISMNKTFLEIVMASKYTEEALQELRKKKNLRIIKINSPITDALQWVKVDGGMIVQTIDDKFSTEFNIVTKKQPTEEEKQYLYFAQRVVKYVKSNAIVVCNENQAIGISGGEVNRIWSTQQAIERARSKTKAPLVLASDAFFPFRDVVDYAAKQNITAIIQPGGSMRDEESIQACNEYGISMIFTGMRHFLH